MKTIKEIIELVNTHQLPVRVMDNESLSVPFIAELDGKMYVTFFLYHVQGAYGNAGKKAMVRCVYYINPDDLKDIVEYKTLNDAYEGSDEVIFKGVNVSQEVLDDTNKYDALMDLTDSILKKPEKTKVNLYGQYFEAYVSGQLKIFYRNYGRTYFKWLSSLL